MFNGGHTPDATLTNNTRFYPFGYVHRLTLYVDNKQFDINEKYGELDDDVCEEEITIEDINRDFKCELCKSKYAELFHYTPLHSEAWEYNKVDSQWYLIKQGQGYA